GAEDLALRVAVRPGGCSGFSCEMFFDTDVSDEDQTAEYDGVKDVVDPSSALRLEGATLDPKLRLQATGLARANPNPPRTSAPGRPRRPRTAAGHRDDPPARAAGTRRLPRDPGVRPGRRRARPRPRRVRPDRPRGRRRAPAVRGLQRRRRGPTRPPARPPRRP